MKEYHSRWKSYGIIEPEIEKEKEEEMYPFVDWNQLTEDNPWAEHFAALSHKESQAEKPKSKYSPPTHAIEEERQAYR